jgi:ABC-type lipoprotein release transport system permease subunit
VSPDASVADVGMLSTKVIASENQRRFYLSMLLVFGMLAALLAAVGVYGVTAHVTMLRTREVGIRLALGAGHWRVIRLLVGQGLRAVLIGLAGGVTCAWWLTKSLTANAVFKQFTAQLFHVTPRDPWTLTIVSVAMLLVGSAACFLPARRASGLDPASVLRSE